MFKFLCLFALVSAASAASIASRDAAIEKKEVVPVLRFQTDKQPDGSFSFSYEGGDQSYREETGVVQNAGTDDEALEVSGSYRYIDADGNLVEVHYTAGRNGFVPTGTNILSEISALAKAAATLPNEVEEPQRKSEQFQRKSRSNVAAEAKQEIPVAVVVMEEPENYPAVQKVEEVIMMMPVVEAVPAQAPAIVEVVPVPATKELPIMAVVEQPVVMETIVAVEDPNLIEVAAKPAAEETSAAVVPAVESAARSNVADTKPASMEAPITSAPVAATPEVVKAAVPAEAPAVEVVAAVPAVAPAVEVVAAVPAVAPAVEIAAKAANSETTATEVVAEVASKAAATVEVPAVKVEAKAAAPAEVSVTEVKADNIVPAVQAAVVAQAEVPAEVQAKAAVPAESPVIAVEVKQTKVPVIATEAKAAVTAETPAIKTDNPATETKADTPIVKIEAAVPTVAPAVEATATTTVESAKN